MRAGSPTACRCAITRPGHSCAQWPSRADSDGGQAKADRHRLAVQEPAAIAALGLQRMAEGVAEVEQGAAALLALLALVGGDDGGFQAAGFQHRMRQRRRVAGDTAAGPCASHQCQSASPAISPCLATSA